MKVSAILGSLAIYGIQVHAIPTDLDSQAIQPIEASSPNLNGLETRDTYCCVGLSDMTDDFGHFVPRGPGRYVWNMNKRPGCMVIVMRNPNDCSGWTFAPRGCSKDDMPIDVRVRSADYCQENTA
ncbi:hypothetical protein E4U19_001617 [Claviceps sp. Clav32 group G5]|nr:hypothetical protein E4U19_001617 [Claviceps sp. Clav32 group G5]KAG6035116.1 hypothetical protein E4U40_002950 [Claviceps sp. LM458 group G5]KAG6046904.1 hypothetical protein E4U39_000931 [Claviceps sp. Clav50 group G5]